MARQKSERITLRLPKSDSLIIQQIKNSGDFDDVSTTIRFCINFTNTILNSLPETIGLSFIEAEKKDVKKEDKLV